MYGYWKEKIGSTTWLQRSSKGCKALTQMVASNWLQPKAQAKSASKPGEKASKPPRRSGSADRSAMGKGLQPLDRIRKEEGRNYTKRSLPHIKNFFGLDKHFVRTVAGRTTRPLQNERRSKVFERRRGMCWACDRQKVAWKHTWLHDIIMH